MPVDWNDDFVFVFGVGTETTDRSGAGAAEQVWPIPREAQGLPNKSGPIPREAQGPGTSLAPYLGEAHTSGGRAPETVPRLWLSMPFDISMIALRRRPWIAARWLHGQARPDSYKGTDGDISVIDPNISAICA